MCLGVPGQIVSRIDGYGDQLALVELSTGRTRVNIGMLDGRDVTPGNWVVVHMGFALEVIDPAEAGEALAGLDLIDELRSTAVTGRTEGPMRSLEI